MGNDLIINRGTLGGTGLNVSKLCWGTLSFSPYHSKITPEEAGMLLKAGYKRGINFWDGAELYETYSHMQSGLEVVGQAEDIVISSRSYAQTREEMLLSIDKCRRALNRDIIEIFGLHEVRMEEFRNGAFRKGALQALAYAKEKGIIKAVSLTSHSAKVVMQTSKIEEIDVIMPLINYKGIGIRDGNLNDMEEAVSNAKAAGKGIFAMKVLAGGLFTEDIKKSFHYALNNPHIDAVAVGMSCIDELDCNIKIFTGNANQTQDNLRSKRKRVSIEPWCSACGRCIKICPQNAIVLEYGIAKVLHDKCMLCGYCISACEDFNIKFVNS